MSTALPQNWVMKSLRELLVSFESGSRPKGGVKGIKSGVPSLGGEHLDPNGGFKFQKIKYVPEAFAAKMTRGRIRPRDILVVKDGATTGKTSFVESSFPYAEAVINEHVFLCRCKEGVEPKYVFYFLYSVEGNRQILEDFRGAAQGGISQRFAEIVNVPLAPLEQQKHIVAEIEKQFSRLDEAVANLRRVKANLKRYKASVLKAAVEGRLVETEAEIAHREGRDYETGEQLLERILETRRKEWKEKARYKEPNSPDASGLPKIPEGWTWVTLESIARVIDPNPSHRMPKYVASGIPFISSENFVGEETIDFRIGKQVSGETLRQQREKFSIEKGDFVLSRIGTIGKTRFLPVGKDYCLSHALVVIKVFSGKVHKEWLRRAISSDTILSQVREGVQSVGVPDLGMAKIRNFNVPLPPTVEQGRIAEEIDRRLSLLSETERQVDANLQRADHLRQSILALAFFGDMSLRNVSASNF